MADTIDLGSIAYGVQVQVLSPAPYYEKSAGAFRNLSELDISEAQMKTIIPIKLKKQTIETRRSYVDADV